MKRPIPFADLLESPVMIVGPGAKIEDRHLAEVGAKSTVQMRLRLEHQHLSAPEIDQDEIDDLLSLRNTDGFGSKNSVACPACEEAGDGPCPWCHGNGLVTLDQWDTWFEEQHGCLQYKEGCERWCKRSSCPQDERRAELYVPVLVLEAKKLDGSWTRRGDSVSGFRLDGLVRNKPAMWRFLSLVATSLGFGLVDDD